MSLFHNDNHVYFDMERLQDAARTAMAKCSLIQRCREGDRAAAIAHSRGFWPVYPRFRKKPSTGAPILLISRASRSMRSSAEAMTRRERWSVRPSRSRFCRRAKSPASFEDARAGLVEMQKDEFRHSKHGEADARNLGLSYEVLQSEPAPSVDPALDRWNERRRLGRVFRQVSRLDGVHRGRGWRNTGARARLYSPVRARAVDLDGSPHRAARRRTVAHEEIVMDFARAYDDSGSPKRIEDLVLQWHRTVRRSRQTRSRRTIARSCRSRPE